MLRKVLTRKLNTRSEKFLLDNAIVPSRKDHESVWKLLPLTMTICGLEQTEQAVRREEEAGIWNEEAEEEELDN